MREERKINIKPIKTTKHTMVRTFNRQKKNTTNTKPTQLTMLIRTINLARHHQQYQLHSCSGAAHQM